jgi:hypothetical protein
MKNVKKQEIKSLMILLSLALICACFLIALLLYTYSSRIITVDRILVSSHTINEISYIDYNPLTHSQMAFSFDKIEFMNVPISFASYQNFYDSLENIPSVSCVSEDIIAAFDQPMRLIIFAKDKEGGSRIFQEAQFIEESDFFRIQTHDDSKKWFYFSSKSINKHVKNFLS